MPKSEFLKAKNTITENKVEIVLSGMKSHDIECKADWQLAELKFQLYKNEISE